MALLTTSKETDSPKRALVLAGGGMRVAYQAGVLVALEEAGLTFDHVDGTSGGTINTAMLFSGNSPQQMCERWSSLHVQDFVSYLPLQRYANPIRMTAMGDADGIIEKVYPHLGIDVSKINQPQAAVATFNVCNHSTKQNLSFTNEQVRLEHLIAGISLPIFMPAVKIDGDFYTDSAWIKDANLMGAVKRGAEEIWLVWCIGNSHDYYDGPFPQYVHMIEISANGGLLEEFDRINELNERILRGDSPFGQKQPIRLKVIKPTYPIPLDPDFYLGLIQANELIAIGYQNTKKWLSTPDFVPMDWKATHMLEPGPQLHFRLAIAAQTQKNNLLQLDLRCHFYELSENCDFAARPTEIFALLTWGNRCRKIAAHSANWISNSANEPKCMELYFDNGNQQYRLLIRFSQQQARVQITENSATQPADELIYPIPKFRWLLFPGKLQLKGALSFFEKLRTKWRFITWLG